MRESQCDLRQCLKEVEHFSKGARGSHVMQNSEENFALDNGHNPQASCGEERWDG